MDLTLPLKAIDDSELFGSLKAKKLKGPNAIAYDSKAWIHTAAAISSPTKRDTDLLVAALHFGLEFESLRLLMDGELPRLAPRDAVDFVVAGLNVQTSTIISRGQAKLRKRVRASGIGFFGDAGDIRVRNSGHQNLNPDDALANLVDSMANLLYRASETEGVSSSVDRENALRRAHSLMTFASIEQGLKDLWGRAAWEGYTIQKFRDHSVFKAGDEAFSKLWLAWQRRFETIMLQEGHLQAGETLVRDDRSFRPPLLARTILRFEDRVGRKQRYIIGKSHRNGEEQASTLNALKSTYLCSFLDEVLPNSLRAGLTYRDLWRAWWVLQDIAKVHQACMPSRGLRSWDQMNRCVLRFKLSSAIQAFADITDISYSSAEIVMNIFTTDPDLKNPKNANDLFQHGTWGRPVVRSPGESHGRIVLASLMSPNPVMTMEHWMARTGMLDDPKGRRNKTVKGQVFERVALERLGAAGAKNNHLTDFRVASLPARGEGTEEIDVLVRFGSTIAVCEMKCLNVPFEPLDRYNHLGKLEEAANQAKRKAGWCRGNPTLIFKALSIPENYRICLWQFVPVVVLNTAYGAGLMLDGCAVTDLNWMSTFLGSPEVVIGGVFGRGRGATMRSRNVYRDQADLERRFAEISVAPPSLAVELNRIEWEMMPFPTRLAEPFLLQVPVSKGMPDLSLFGD